MLHLNAGALRLIYMFRALPIELTSISVYYLVFKITLGEGLMKIKNTVISLLAFLLLSGVLMTTVSAEVWSPSLPTTLVTIEITNPYTTPLCPSSYPFIIALSNVDSGFDVADGTYTGWCTDITHGITRGLEYDVMLYSSYDPIAPIPSEDWNRINYILNNKQGTGCEVQAAIWYFINGGAYWWIAGDPFDPSVDTEVQNMVGDAIAYGGTYEPGIGDILAIVCVPDDETVQVVIIELTIPCEGPGLTPGFWKHNVGIYLTSIGTLTGKDAVNGAYSDPVNSPVVNKDNMGTWLASLTPAQLGGKTLLQLYTEMKTKGGGAAGAETRQGAANVFNALAGLSTTVIV